MKDKTINVVVDNGNNHHKVAFIKDGKITVSKKATRIGTAQEAQTNFQGEFENMYQTDEGETYICDDSVQSPIRTRHEQYGLSTENRVLLNSALCEAGLSGYQIRLSTALPVSDYFLDTGKKNEALIKGQAENMKKPVYMIKNQDREPNPICKIIESRVHSEGIAALMDFLFDDDGKPNYPTDDLHAPVAVMDFGGSTFDVVALSSKLNILHDNTGTIKRGAIDIQQNFAGLLLEHLTELGVEMRSCPDWMIKQGMNQGFIRHQWKKQKVEQIDVTGLINKAAEPVVNELKKFAVTKLKNLNNYQIILLVGGGALLCKELFSDWIEEHNLIVLDEYANAKGMLKYVSYVRPTH